MVAFSNAVVIALAATQGKLFYAFYKHYDTLLAFNCSASAVALRRQVPLDPGTIPAGCEAICATFVFNRDVSFIFSILFLSTR